MTMGESRRLLHAGIAAWLWRESSVLLGGACIVRDGLGRAKGGFALDSEFRAPPAGAAGGSEIF